MTKKRLYDYYKLINKYEKSFINDKWGKNQYNSFIYRYTKSQRLVVEFIKKKHINYDIIKIDMLTNKTNQLNIKHGNYLIEFK